MPIDLRKDYDFGRLLLLSNSDRDHLRQSFLSQAPFSKHSNMAGPLSYFNTYLTSPTIKMFEKLQKSFTTPDLAITVPFDIKSLSYFSLLRARALRQTKARWCWFDKASKDDQEAGSSLGTLRFLPYEIRQQIFEIVLEDYFDEFDEQIRQRRNNFEYKEALYTCDGALNRSELFIQHWCWRQYEVRRIFDLQSYHTDRLPTERHPLSLRLASPSIQAEFDGVFLGRSTFQFACPVTLQMFLDQLSPLQQRQLKRLTLCMFLPKWICCSGSLARRDQWMSVCQRLPPGLKSVKILSPDHLTDVPRFWTNASSNSYLDQVYTKRVAAELLEVLCKKMSRASPRAGISWIYRKKLCKEERDALDSVLAELEPWSGELQTWMDGIS